MDDSWRVIMCESVLIDNENLYSSFIDNFVHVVIAKDNAYKFPVKMIVHNTYLRYWPWTRKEVGWVFTARRLYSMQ